MPAGENDWVEAQINRPLVTGDKLWTDNGSRAELEIGSAAMRMDGQTSFDFLNLDDNAAQVELTQGSLNLRVRRLYDGQTYEIDTPTLAFVANRVGEFRIDVQPDGQTTVVSVMHGGGDVYGEGGSRFHVDEGQSVTFSDPQLQNYESADLPQADDFDNFALQRDGRWDNSPSKRYVSEDLIGYQDLDDYGSWDDAPEYGHVWYPSHVEADWSPYHSGHWAWVGAYGWTWVDRRTVGLRAVALRPLGLRRQPLGLVPGRNRRASGVCAGAGRLRRRRRRASASRRVRSAGSRSAIAIRISRPIA